MKYNISVRKDCSELDEQIIELMANAWPDFIDGEKVMRAYWGFIEDTFPECQIVVKTNKDEVVAVTNSAMLSYNDDVKNLDEKGLYWGLKKISHDFYKNNKPNTLMALQITIKPEYKGKGISYICLEELTKIAKSKGFEKVIVPLRPSMKHMYPLMDSEKYLEWTNDDGLPFDPWLRANVKFGGKLVKQCNGIAIAGNVKDWEKWTGLKFPYSGEYIIPGALNTVNVDLDKDWITYKQKNVWAVHEIH